MGVDEMKELWIEPAQKPMGFINIINRKTNGRQLIIDELELSDEFVNRKGVTMKGQ